MAEDRRDAARRQPGSESCRRKFHRPSWQEAQSLVTVFTASHLTGAGAEQYFKLDLEREGAALVSYRYYVGELAQPVVVGRGAEVLGVAGAKFTPQMFSDFCKGIGPNGERLRQNWGDDSDAAWDFTINFSKSVSVAALLGDEASSAQIREIAAQTTASAVRQIEKLALTRRGKGGSRFETVAGLIVAPFWHVESRDGDPHLHCHLVVFNACLRHDGTWGALHSRSLYNAKMALGAMATAEMGVRLRAEGVALRKTADGHELRGIPPELLATLSKGRRRILEKADALGYRSAKALEAINVYTRPSKVPRDLSEMVMRWRMSAEVMGVTPQSIASLLGRSRKVNLDRLRGNARRAARWAVGQVAARSSTFSATEVQRVAALACRQGFARIDDIVRAVEHVLEADRRVVRIGAKEGRAVYSTRQNLAAERVAVADALAMRRVNGHGLWQWNMVWAAVAHELDREQEAALKYLGGKGAVKVVCGPAGTGKTRLLSALSDAARAQGKRVIGLAPTGVAREQLRSGATIEESFTLAKFQLLMKPSPGWALRHHVRMLARKAVNRRSKTFKWNPFGLQKGDYVVLDEAAMVGFRDLAKLIRQVKKAGAKLILCGDDRQLGPVLAGASLFSELAARVGHFELQKNWRQRAKPWMRYLSEHLREGESEQALGLLAFKKRLHVARGLDSPIDACVERYMDVPIAARRQTLILASTRRQVATLNERVQQSRKERREVVGGPARMPAQDSPADWAEAARKQAQFFVGDRVVLRKNSSKIPMRMLAGTGYASTPQGVVVNGDFGEVVAARGRQMRVRLDRRSDSGQPMCVDINLSKYSDVELGYAATVHRAQGRTVERALVVVDPGNIDAELSYVALTRQSHDLHVFAHESVVGHELADLARSMSRSRREELATVVREQLLDETSRQERERSGRRLTI